MNRVFIGVGSNIEPRNHYLERAIHQLKQHEEITVIAKSSIYETAPVGFTEQEDFLNMVIELETALKSIDLLRYCQQIEMEQGRKRTIKNGPRTLDLDILLYNEDIVMSPQLTIPHPRLHERAFVLVPFNEIAPDVFVPKLERTITQLLKELSTTEVEQVVKWKGK